MTYTIDQLQSFINDRRSDGFECNTLKFHCHKNDVGDLNSNKTIQSKYANSIMNILNQIDGISQVTILNEYTNVVEDTSDLSWVKALVNNIKNKNIKVGITFRNRDSFQIFKSLHQDIFELLDLICINYYPFISIDGDQTSKSQFIDVFNRINLYSKFMKYKYNKKFIISEVGCIPYNEALTAPWKYDSKNTEFFPDGAVYNPSLPLRYIQGLNENPYTKYVDEVWGWFCSNVIYKEDKDYDKYVKYMNSIMR